LGQKAMLLLLLLLLLLGFVSVAETA